jgi:hypothetical protein
MTTYQRLPPVKLTLPLACAVARDLAIVAAALAYVIDLL